MRKRGRAWWGTRLLSCPRWLRLLQNAGPAQRGEAYGDWASDNQQLIQVQEAVGEGHVLFHSDLHQTLEDHQATLGAKKEKLQFQAQRQAQNISASGSSGRGTWWA